MRKLPKLQFSIFNFQFSITIVLIIFFLLSLIPTDVQAAFAGGINVGDHHNEMQTVGDLDNSWLYVMMRPSDGATLNAFLSDSKYSDVKVIVRGHFPDLPLTDEYAVSWADTLEGISRPIYFVPVNEPNNPNESSGGITATNVKNYISVLRSELTARGLLGSKVKLLSPAMDVYQLADYGNGYVEELGGWSFFSQFEGVALNLYGQYRGGALDTSAPAIKRGTGYREMFKGWGASEVQAQAVKVFAVESGVLQVEAERVKYKENTALIKNYFDALKSTWASDPNFVMFAVFSYDPGGDKTSWIYTASGVLQSMNIGIGSVRVDSDGTLQETADTGNTTGADPAGESLYSDEQMITKNANERLLPRTIISKRDKEQEGCANGFSLFGITCIPWFGAGLAHETQYFQPGFVTRDKVIDDENDCGGLGCLFNSIGGLFSSVIHPQTAKNDTGALNAFRPRSLSFFQGRNGLNTQPVPEPLQVDAGSPKDGGQVLAEETGDPEVDVKDAYLFTMRMLLPRSLKGQLANNTTGTNGPVGQPDDGTLQETSDTTIITPAPTDSNSESFTSIRQLANQAAQWVGMPWQIVEAMLIIEGSGYQKGMDLDTLNIGVFGLTPQEIQDFSKPNAKADIYCSINSCSAAGVMQMTTVGCYPFDTCLTKKDDTHNADCSSCGGACTYKPSAWSYYKDAVLEAEDDGRTPNICNIKDSIYAGAKKMKNDSKTPFGVLSDWSHETVNDVAEAYYGSCTPCNVATGGGKYACDRLGMTYCDFVWNYYQARKSFTVPPVTTPAPGLPDTSDTAGNPVYFSQKEAKYNKELSSDYPSCADPNDPPGRLRLDKAGCGQTTMAMILATYLDSSITPVDAVNTYYGSLSCAGTTPSQAVDILENETGGKFMTAPVFDQIAVGEEYYTYDEAVAKFKKFFDAGWQIWGNADINGRGHHFWVTGISEERLLVMDPTYGIGQPYPMVQSKVGNETGAPTKYKRAFAFKLKSSIGSPL